MPTSCLGCPACQSDQHQIVYAVDGFDIARCRNCNSRFVTTLPDQNEIQSIYLEENYYQLQPASLDRIKLENARRCRTFKKLVQGRSLLDVGCAAGYFLDEAREVGFEVCGVEQTPHTAAQARSRGHRITLGTLDDLVADDSYRRQGYDVVTALDVIEHVPDPRDFLQKLVDLASPGGLIMLSTPNYSGVVAKLLGPHDPYMIPPEHLNFFTIAGLRALAQQTGTSIEKIETFGRLTAPDMVRQGARLLPGFLKPLHYPCGWFIGQGIRALNLATAGIEVEVYLRKPLAAARPSVARAA